MNIYEDEKLDQALRNLSEDVPPMPEDFHAGWMKQVEEEAMEKTRKRTPWSRILSTAAALVFVVGGTLLTKDSLSPATANTAKYASEAYEADSTYGSVVGYSMRSAANGTAETAYYDDAVATVEDTASTQEQKIIRTASLSISTQSFEESLAALKQLCLDKGGWVAYAYESDSTTRRTASLTLRIPAQELDSFLTGAGDTGRITSRSESADDVTESYYDTKTRLETQQALMTRLQALITDAADLSDLLTLESQIADTQYQIDRLQSSLDSTNRQVSYATVDVSLREEVPADSLTDPERSLSQRILDGMTAGLNACASFFADMLVFLAAALPFIGIAGAAAVVFIIIKRKK